MSVHRLNSCDDARNLGRRDALLFSELSRCDVAGKTATLSARLVLNGLETYRAFGRAKTLSPGEVLLVGKGIDLGVAIESQSPVAGLCLQIYGAPAAPLDSEAFVKLTAAQSLFGRGVRKHFAMAGAGADVSVLARRFDALSRLGVWDLVRIERRLARIPAAKASTRSDVLERLERSRSLIAGNASGSLDMSVVAASCGFSRFHFSRLFKEVYGETPACFQGACRMRAAAAMIEKGELALREIADRLGYTHYATFSRAFRRYAGHAPSCKLSKNRHFN